MSVKPFSSPVVPSPSSNRSRGLDWKEVFGQGIQLQKLDEALVRGRFSVETMLRHSGDLVIEFTPLKGGPDAGKFNEELRAALKKVEGLSTSQSTTSGGNTTSSVEGAEVSASLFHPGRA